MKKSIRIMMALFVFGLLTASAEAKRPKAPGERIKSGEFYDMVKHRYAKVLPPLVETKDVEKVYANTPLDKVRFKLKDEDGKLWDSESRKADLKKRWAESSTNWNIQFKVKKVTMTDATHGAVLYLFINDWENPSNGRYGRFSRYRVSHWEKIDGKWLIVRVELGSAMRDH